MNPTDTIIDPQLQRLIPAYGKTLLHYRDRALELLADLGRCKHDDIQMLRIALIFAKALDEARMASENGRSLGTEFIKAVEIRLNSLATDNKLSHEGRLALSECWIKAGLMPPKCLAKSDSSGSNLNSAPPDSASIALLRLEIESIVNFTSESVNQSLFEGYAIYLSASTDSIQYALAKDAVSTPKEVYADLGCALLFMNSETVSRGVIDGFIDRLNSGNLDSWTLEKLAIVQNWLVDDALVSQLDQLFAQALTHGLQVDSSKQNVRHFRLVASFVDRNGAQAIASTVQYGKMRYAALLLLKQGHGVKDVIIRPCNSANQQRATIDSFMNELDIGEWQAISIEFLRQNLAFALWDGLQNKVNPTPGLVEYAQFMGLSDIRPAAGTIEDLLSVLDPEGSITDLPESELEILIADSKYWVEKIAIIRGWCEDGDEMEAALKNGTPRDQAWTVLEKSRREHWAMCIARNALLVREAKSADLSSFIAVLKAFVAGWDLQRIPIMELVVDHTLMDWEDANDGLSDSLVVKKVTEEGFDEVDQADFDVTAHLENMFRILNELPHSTPFSLNWLQGYMTALRTMPFELDEIYWMNCIKKKLQFKPNNEDDYELMDLGLQQMHVGIGMVLNSEKDIPLLPLESSELSDWASGFLTVWNEFPLHWPVEFMGRIGKSIKELLRDAEAEKLAPEEIVTTVSEWLEENCGIRQKITYPEIVPI